MKKGWKIFWICIAILTGIGILCCTAAFCLGFSFSELKRNYPNGIGIIHNDDRSDEDEWDDEWDEIKDTGEGKEFSDIKNLKIKADYCQLLIAKSKDDKIRVDDSRLKKENKLKMETEDDGETLRIELEMQSAEEKHQTIGIYIPEDMTFDKVNIDVGAADMKMKDIQAKILSIKSGASNCSVENATVGQLKTETGAGDLDFYGTVNGNIDVKCGAGDVEFDLKGKEENYNYDLRGGTGSIEIGEDTEIDGLSGNRLIDNNTSDTIQIVNGAGNIEIDFH